MIRMMTMTTMTTITHMTPITGLATITITLNTSIATSTAMILTLMIATEQCTNTPAGSRCYHEIEKGATTDNPWNNNKTTTNNPFLLVDITANTTILTPNRAPHRNNPKAAGIA